jgi:hypothetical protein
MSGSVKNLKDSLPKTTGRVSYILSSDLKYPLKLKMYVLIYFFLFFDPINSFEKSFLHNEDVITNY